MSTPETPEGASEVYRRYVSAVLFHGHAAARACGLGATDLYALNILRLAGAMTPGELAARTGLTTGPTTRLIDRLERAGHVRRTPDASDRRKVLVEPLAVPAALDEALEPARRGVGEIIADCTPEEREVLFGYFARAADAYQRAAEQLRGGGA
ncbi:MarR family winged helix-turn-helix transcriptional regulator [Kitasatospora sp. NPDC093550]|uniref:MarR family winged helix-turn-helix transcriptional regulator n=1 Tax=Kitasatospora sp. NPDC093550 TaxID=3364089 RepID=UPI00380B6B80